MMRRTNIYLDQEQLDALRERGLRERRSVADLVRAAVDSSIRPPGTGVMAKVVAAAGALPSGNFPKEGGGWRRRPYFLQEAQISWAEFVDLLHSGEDEHRRWALTRLLVGARWEDIWRLVSLGQLEADLSHLRFRGKDFWVKLVDAAA